MGDFTEHFDSKIDFKLFNNNPQYLRDLAYLHAVRLEKVRKFAEVPVIVTSFYRDDIINKGTKYAAVNSLHTRGLAVDITLSKKDKRNKPTLLLQIYEFMKYYFSYGELFLYELPSGLYDSIHFSLEAKDNIQEALIYIKTDSGKLIKKTDYQRGK